MLSPGSIPCRTRSMPASPVLTAGLGRAEGGGTEGGMGIVRIDFRHMAVNSRGATAAARRSRPQPEASHDALIEHRIRHLDEARNIGAEHVVPGRAVFRGGGATA